MKGALPTPSTGLVFDATVEDADAGFHSKFTLLCVCFAWSPSSRELYNAVKEVAGELPLQVRVMDGDGALDYCTKNGIVYGAGGVKVFSNGRECCVRRNTGSVYTITTPLLRPSQVKELVEAIVAANRDESIATVTF